MKTHRAYTTILRYQIEIFSFWRDTNKYVTVNTRTIQVRADEIVRDERKFFYLLLEWEEFNLPRTDSDCPRLVITLYPLENFNFNIHLVFNIFISFFYFIYFYHFIYLSLGDNFNYHTEREKDIYSIKYEISRTSENLIILQLFP